MRMVCADCLDSVDMRSSASVDEPKTCDRCGGLLESQGAGGLFDSVSTCRTPESLELTPEDDTVCADGAGDQHAKRFVVPTHIGRFQLREYLGGGGFGQVYRAYDPRLEREVALKVLKDARPSGRILERFFREARAAAQLDHANIIGLHDAGRDGGRCWIAYQYVPGRTLSRVRALHRPNPEDAARIVRALADAMDHAHNRGVFHRDLKPSNILIDDDGRVRITDFGLARRSTFEPALTLDGTILGTPAYMSPEQAAGRSHAADARSDVYSLGVILYELLCGRRPNDLPSDAPAWRVEPLSLSFSPPRKWDRRIPRALDRICRRALVRDPMDRYPDARALADDLDAWLSWREGNTTRRRLTIAAVGGFLAALAFHPVAPPRVEPARVPTQEAAPVALSKANPAKGLTAPRR